MVFSPAAFLEIDRYAHALDRAASRHVEGNNSPRHAPKPLVIIESPYAGNVEQNMAYARSCLLDSLERGEAPIASHLLHTQVLDDDVPEQRKWGIEAGLAWYAVAGICAVYTDYGISDGMKAGIARAELHGVQIEYRRLDEGDKAKSQSFLSNLKDLAQRNIDAAEAVKDDFRASYERNRYNGIEA